MWDTRSFFSRTDWDALGDDHRHLRNRDTAGRYDPERSKDRHAGREPVDGAWNRERTENQTRKSGESTLR